MSGVITRSGCPMVELHVVIFECCSTITEERS